MTKLHHFEFGSPENMRYRHRLDYLNRVMRFTGCGKRTRGLRVTDCWSVVTCKSCIRTLRSPRPLREATIVAQLHRARSA